MSSEMRKVPLIHLAYARCGEKGDSLNIGVIARDERAYPLIKEKLTAKRVAEYLRPLLGGEVVRYELPNLGALNFVFRHGLEGGGTRNLRFDFMGRSVASALLQMEIEVDQPP